MRIVKKRNNDKRYKSGFVFQQDQSDCGVACLLNLIKYHGGTNKLENIRELSGTTKQGTSMLGLYQAAQKLGFDAEGLEANIDFLKKIDSPYLLHVIIDKRLQHFIIVYDYNGYDFIIGDPDKGVIKMTEDELKNIWPSKALLKLTPSQNFIKKEKTTADKKQWLIRLLKEDINVLVIIFVLGIVTSILSLALPIFSQQLIDNVLPDKNKLKLIMGVVLVGFILMSKNGLSYLINTFVITQGKNFNNRLINKFFNNLLYLPKSFFDNRKTGELVARMNDTNRIQDTIIQIVGDILQNALFVIFSCAVIFFYSNIIGLILIAAIPLYYFIAYKYHKPIVTKQQEVMEANANKTSNYVNSLEGIDTIKTINKEREFAYLNKIIYGLFQEKI